jgi:heptosyltransferase-2
MPCFIMGRMAQIDCRHFTGYKPCGLNSSCDSQCSHFQPIRKRILLIHLEALGAVLRSTSLLPAIQRKYPHAHLTWVTKAPAHALLREVTGIDRVLTVSPTDLLTLAGLSFDLALVVDKSLEAMGVLRQTRVNEVRGFVVDGRTQAIVPANPEASELWQLGLSNQQKFFVNQKSEQQLVHEALALGTYARDEYQVHLSSQELAVADLRRQTWSTARQPVIGINTGCSLHLPHKKLSVDGHRRLLQMILRDRDLAHCSVVLLGGPEDSERNRKIAHGLPVHLSPTELGLRDGLVSVAACDVVFSGDSLGMHMAIGLQKWVVTWFGPTCAQEIELYGRGRKIHTSAACSPCWKRVCQQTQMCYDQVDFKACTHALVEGLQWLTSYSKPHSPEISFSPSPY